MIELLKYSLDNLASLQHFHGIVEKSVFTEYKKACEKYEFGAMVDHYLTMVFKNDEDLATEPYEKIRNSIEKEVEILGRSQDETGGSLQFRFRNIDELKKKGIETDVRKAATMFRKYSDMPVIHGNNMLIMLITRFEEFISMLLSDVFKRFPHKYLDKQQICYSEILNCGIEEVQEKIISREIDAIMRESYKDWFELLEKHGMRFDACQKEMLALNEVYSRRNIIVHNSGIVNEIYLKNVPDAEETIGKRLFATPLYLNEAFSIIETIVFSVMIEASHLLPKEERADYLDKVFNLAFEKLCIKKYKLCSIIFDQLRKSKYVDSQIKMLSLINYWISKKHLGQFNEVVADIRAYDVSALNDRYGLAKEVLLENNDAAMRIIERLYPHDISVFALENWPLFLELRKTEQYEKFKDKHSQDFSTPSIEIDEPLAKKEPNQEEQDLR